MRKLIVANIVSIDGYYEGPGQNVMALPMDHSFDAYNAERLRAADTLLLGRNSYEGFKGYWPGVADDPDASEDAREISRLDDTIEKVVVSDTLTEDDTEPWADTTRIVRRADAHDQVAELKQGSGGEILMFGSRTLWNDLLAAGLVDELHLMVGPVVLGDGTPAFPKGLGGTALDPSGRRLEVSSPLRLLDTRTFDDSSNVLLRYAVAAA